MIIASCIGFSILGFIDDILIVKYKNNKGISPIFKLLLQTIISSFVFFLYLSYNSSDLNLFVININFKWLYGVLIMWVLVSSTNAWNLIDGIDGLCAGCSLIFGIGLGIIAFKQEEYLLLEMMIIFLI